MGELLEEMEHAAHAGGHGHGHGDGKAGIGKYVGITMAILGVMMALCSALVGMSRTDLIATMVKQTETSNRSQSVSSKYRLMESQLQSTHAFLITDPEAAKKKEDEIDGIEKGVAGTPSAAGIKVARLETANLMESVIPSTDDVVAMARTTARYRIERDAAHEWAESYEDKVAAYEHAGGRYEYAQLMAEIGIVLASIALLLQSKAAWSASMVLGLLAMVVVGHTYVTSQKTFTASSAKINKAEEEYQKVSNDKADDEADEKLIADTLKMAPAPEPGAKPAGGGEGKPEAKPAEKKGE